MTDMQEQARAALAAKAAAERNLAELALCPPWRHAAFAGIMAALVASPAAPLAWRSVILVFVFAAIALVIQSDKKRLGVFINGYRRGRTRLVTFPMLAIVMGIYVASMVFGMDRHRPEISLALGVVTFGIAYVGSVLWQRVFVRELGA